MKMQFISILTDAGFISSAESDANLNFNADNWPLVKGVLVAGLFPSVARVNFGRNRVILFTINYGAVKVPPGSVKNVHPTPIIHIAGLYSTKRSDQLLFFFWMLPRLRQWLSVSFGFQLNCHSIRDALLGALRVGPGHISIGEKREE